VLGALAVLRFGVLSSLAICVPALPAGAALKIDSDTTAESLTVDVHGRAQVSWTVNGTRRTAVVAGSSVRYRGRLTKAASAARVAPTVPFALVQLRLPDGEQFALQRLRRTGQYGALGPWELYLARWHGDPTQLTVTESRRRVCGTVTYHGAAVYGSAHTRTGNPLDSLGRNIYIDSLRPSGWYRLMGVLARPRGYALAIRRGWLGSRYRARVIGPNIGGDLAPVASAMTSALSALRGNACPFPPGMYAHA
jgi:hypothetical protein